MVVVLSCTCKLIFLIQKPLAASYRTMRVWVLMQCTSNAQVQGCPRCSPIAYRVFGTDDCCAWLKFQVMNSLIIRRLLNGAHVVCPNASYIRRLQSVYLRVPRRMYGESSSERTCHTDKETRVMSQHQYEICPQTCDPCATCFVCPPWCETQF